MVLGPQGPGRVGRRRFLDDRWAARGRPINRSPAFVDSVGLRSAPTGDRGRGCVAVAKSCVARRGRWSRSRGVGLRRSLGCCSGEAGPSRSAQATAAHRASTRTIATDASGVSRCPAATVAYRGEADHRRRALLRAQLGEAALGGRGIAGQRAQRSQREAEILQAQRMLQPQPRDPFRGGIKRASPPAAITARPRADRQD
jgi:hypothetical protein